MRNKIAKVVLSVLLVAVVAVPVLGNASPKLHGGIVTIQSGEVPEVSF
ncbi:hypothetical protein [Clostridium folliculivorans]|uniref:Uncharacterized protein n=1 Tax=Clostridium folliculivorans TaxID=2886038 RepID=A0A9W5Y5Q0_9CLOT|nr:hypothetical protein [Clostridium folliculivorans]GKU27219.1 hypothetical protein CFOLD11_40460 [Clostridium folliculivorans]GKU31632.1 hypothetical protein CFB3_37390 [Clostridium folliculivorans]